MGSRQKMRLASPLLIVLSMASALPTKNRDQKAFSLFSVVHFPNLECTTQMSDEMKGICLTSEECRARSGEASGNCASGFGVCCFSTVEDLTATIVNNMTYIQNPGFPTPHVATTAALNYRYSLQAADNTAAIRLNFHTAVLQQPTAASGACDADIMTTTAASRPATAIHTLCGTFSGQHMYLENNGAANTANTITFTLPISTFARSWKVLVMFIEEGNPGIAGKPSGCLQWFTGLSNQVSSFNHAVGGAMGILNDDSYSVCIRREGNNDCVEWREAGGATDSFALGNAAAAVANNPAQSGFKAAVAAAGGNPATPQQQNCIQSYVTIPNNDVLGPHYCGSVLGEHAQTAATSVLSDSHHIQVVGLVGAAFRAATAAASGGAVGSGFDLIYVQKAC